MSNGRHFNPPTPAYRPRDPFASFEPRSAERIPSCETTKPPPSRPRPVRVDASMREGKGQTEDRSGEPRVLGAAPASTAPANLSSQPSHLPQMPPSRPVVDARGTEAAHVAARPVAEHRPVSDDRGVAAAIAARHAQSVDASKVAAPPVVAKVVPIAKVEPVVAKAEPQPKVAEPVAARPAVKVEPAKAEAVVKPLAKVEPAKAEPVKAEPAVRPAAKVEPIKAEPAKAEPVAAKPAARTEPVVVKTEPVVAKVATRVQEPVARPAVKPAEVAPRPALRAEPVLKPVVSKSADAAAVHAKDQALEEDPEDLIPAVPEIPEGSLGESMGGRTKVAKRKAAPSKPVAKAEPDADASIGISDEEAANIVLAEGEELRRCEWERCGKLFPVKVTGRTVVRRFCSGTCRGRASEARTGKRGKGA